MTNYDDGDKDGNKDRNDDGIAASISGSNGLIFNLITMPQSRVGVSGDNGNSAAAAAHNVSMSRNIYLPYKTILEMCHKRLYAKIGVLDLCC